jgi:hypothetical protein
MAIRNYDLSNIWSVEQLTVQKFDCLKIWPFELLKFGKLTVEIFAFCNLEFGKNVAPFRQLKEVF